MAKEPRVASLISSATEILHALGLGQYQVGRSHECDFPPGIENLPCCTQPRIDIYADSSSIDQQVKDSLRDGLSIYEVFDDVLERLQPTHLLTQTQCAVCAVSLSDVERSVAGRLASEPKIVSLEPNSLGDIFTDIEKVARALGHDSAPLIGRLKARISELNRCARESGKRPTIAAIEWLEPLMACGNWMPELIEIANGVNLFGEAGKHSPWMSWADLVASDPDCMLITPCGFDLPRTRAEMHWLADREGFRGLRCVREGNVWIADGNQYFNRPGPRVVDSIEILVEILHVVPAGKNLNSDQVQRWIG